MTTPEHTSAPLPSAIRSARMRLYEAPRRDLLVPTVAWASAVLLAFGWWTRDELYVTAESGLGYALGIVGLSMMTTLLFYSALKRLRHSSSRVSVRTWLQFHMLLGILGPVAVLFHANFRLGSLNSTLALAAMLVVATSGLVGRFLYTRIHVGLFGRRLELMELRREVEAKRSGIILAHSPPLSQERMRRFEAFCLAERGWLQSIGRLITLGWRYRATRRCVRGTLATGASSVPETERHAIDSHLDALLRVATIAAYERIFALWHALHLPICVLLFIAATIHVVAVHMY